MRLPFKNALIRTLIWGLTRLLPPEDSLSSVIRAHAERSLKEDLKAAKQRIASQAKVAIAQVAYDRAAKLRALTRDHASLRKAIASPVTPEGARALLQAAKPAYVPPAGILSE